MPFNPMSWHDGQQFKVVFIVRELVKNTEILTIVPTKAGPRLKVITVSKTDLTDLRTHDLGASQERKMKASLRRISRKKGTTKKARAAVQKVLS